jgi:SAM-dependent methyltransferase
MLLGEATLMLGWLRNEVDFRMRQWIRLRRGPARLPGEPKDGLFAGAAAAEAERLVAAYGLERWRTESGRTDFAASLFYAAMVETALREASVSLPDPLTVLDAGAGDWFYVRPLHGMMRWYGRSEPREVSLDGVELDAYALYRGWRSRFDWAEAYVGGLPGVRYLAGEVAAYRRPVDLALMLFPFLFPADARRWGLPRRYVQPEAVLAHVWSLVRPGGTLLIANLGEAERKEQGRLLREAGLQPVWSERFESPLFSYDQPRYVWVITRKMAKKG